MHVSSFKWNLISRESEISYCDSVSTIADRVDPDNFRGRSSSRGRREISIHPETIQLDRRWIRDVDPRRVNVPWKGYVKGYFGAATLVSFVINEGDETFINVPIPSGQGHYFVLKRNAPRSKPCLTSRRKILLWILLWKKYFTAIFTPIKGCSRERDDRKRFEICIEFQRGNL